MKIVHSTVLKMNGLFCMSKIEAPKLKYYKYIPYFLLNNTLAGIRHAILTISAILIIPCINLMLFLIIPAFEDYEKYYYPRILLEKIQYLSNKQSYLILGDWGARIYVTYFTLSNFLAPLIALSFYYTKICGKIRRNLQAKKRMLPRFYKIEPTNIGCSSIFKS